MLLYEFKIKQLLHREKLLACVCNHSNQRTLVTSVTISAKVSIETNVMLVTTKSLV